MRTPHERGRRLRLLWASLGIALIGIVVVLVSLHHSSATTEEVDPATRSQSGAGLPASPSLSPELATENEIPSDRVAVEPAGAAPGAASRSSASELGALRGKVLRAETRWPVANARVTWGGPGGTQSPDWSVTTAEDGSFLLKSLPCELEIRLTVVAEKEMPIVRDVTIPSPGEHPFDIFLDETFELRGLVVDARDHTPIGSARISIGMRPGSMDDTMLPNSAAATCGADGRFVMRLSAARLRAHGFHLVASATGFALTRCSDLARVLAVDRKDAEIEIPMFEAARIEGTVKRSDGKSAEGAQVQWNVDGASTVRAEDETAAGAKLLAKWSDAFVPDSLGARADADANGEFHLDGVAPLREGTLRALVEDCDDWESATKRILPGESARVDIDVVASPKVVANCVLEGRLTYNGAPQPLPYTVIVRGQYLEGPFTANAQGEYRHTGLEPGEAIVSAQVPGIASRSERAQLVAGSTTRLDVDVAAKTSKVGGVVVDADGAIVQNMAISLRAEHGEWRIGSTTDAEGRFHVLTGVAAGDGVVARIANRSVVTEQTFRGGDEQVVVRLARAGRVLLRVIDASSRLPVRSPAIRIRSGIAAAAEIAPANIERLPDGITGIALAEGSYSLEIDATPMFYSPTLVAVTATGTPQPLEVAVQSTATGVLRIEYTKRDDSAGSGRILKIPPVGRISWRRAGDASPPIRIESTAFILDNRAAAEIVLPAGTLEIGFCDGIDESPKVFASVTIVADAAPTLLRVVRKP